MKISKNLIPNPRFVRSKLIDIIYNAQASHLGSNLSAIEILISIYACSNIKKIKNKNNDRSRIIISKGHCAAATYIVLYFFGLMSKKTLENFHKNNSYLAGHVSHSVEYCEHSTGALGHGLPVAVGLAIGQKKLKYKNALTFCLCGDGELQEGSIWEALLLAGHKKLDNLILLIDYNKISSITATNKVINMEPLKKKFESFNFICKEVDGHNIEKIIRNIKKLSLKKKPVALICNTTKGKGVSFSENQAIWHYNTLNHKQYLLAKEELKKNKSQ
jgi:transketolase